MSNLRFGKQTFCLRYVTGFISKQTSSLVGCNLINTVQPTFSYINFRVCFGLWNNVTYCSTEVQSKYRDKNT